MLQVETIGAIGTGRVAQTKGHTVIVRDNLGNPIMVAQEIADGMTNITTVQDGEEFERTLRVLGINKLVTNEVLSAHPSPKGASRLDPNRLGDFIHAAKS